MIQYLGSGPELWVNGSCGEGFMLSDGDQIGFGPFAFSVEMDEGQPRRRDEHSDQERRFTKELLESMDYSEPVDAVRALMAAVRAECNIPVQPPRLYTEVGIPSAGPDLPGDRFVA